jgi:hypothetical protein
MSRNRHCISAPLARLAAAVPSITIVMVPSVRDAVSRHECSCVRVKTIDIWQVEIARCKKRVLNVQERSH